MPRPSESSKLVMMKNFSHAASDTGFDIVAFDQAVDLFKTYLAKRVQFLGFEVALCYDPVTHEVFLTDDNGNVAKMELGELKRWARCQACGAQGFVDGDEPEFVNASICRKCQQNVEQENC